MSTFSNAALFNNTDKSLCYNNYMKWRTVCMDNRYVEKKYIKALNKNLPFFQAPARDTKLKIITIRQNRKISIKLKSRYLKR